MQMVLRMDIQPVAHMLLLIFLGPVVILVVLVRTTTATLAALIKLILVELAMALRVPRAMPILALQAM